MTDEQWLWLFINQAIDTDEELESMCDDCRHEVTSINRCSRCGKLLSPKGDSIGSDFETGVNSNFDMDRYESLKNGNGHIVKDIDEENSSKVDIDLIKQILDQGDENG